MPSTPARDLVDRILEQDGARKIVGLKNVTIYDGSWTEWGNVVGLPVAHPSLDQRRRGAGQAAPRPAAGAVCRGERT